MGSNETATATTGGPRVIAYLTGTGHHRAQINYFFRGYICHWRSLGVGLVVSSRLSRMRRRLELPSGFWIQNFGGSWDMSAPC